LSESAVRDGIGRAHELPDDATTHTAASTLGNGSCFSAQDTVPFTLWRAACRLDTYDGAL
jgi:hypothetical protein